MNDTNSPADGRLRDYLLLAAELAVAGATIYLVWRATVNPDTQREFRMRVARSVARTAKTKAEYWSRIAADADTYYWRTANVTT